MTIRSVVPMRSLLFVPGHRPELVPKAIASGADGVLLDLEDAVPAGEKATARAATAEVLRAQYGGPELFVRINGLDSRLVLDDLEAIVGPGLAAVMVPKVEGPVDVQIVDRLLDWFEESAELANGTVLIDPLVETPRGIRLAFSIAEASPRVAHLGGIGTKGGDVERSMGYRWTAGGESTAAIRSSVLLDARAAGVQNPIAGLWTDLHDLDGLRRFAEANRDLGYEGMLAIHPSHVPVINDVFTPSAAELDRLRALVAAVEEAEHRGLGAVAFDGAMVDHAMAATARARLARAETRR